MTPFAVGQVWEYRGHTNTWRVLIERVDAYGAGHGKFVLPPGDAGHPAVMYDYQDTTWTLVNAPAVDPWRLHRAYAAEHGYRWVEEAEHG